LLQQYQKADVFVMPSLADSYALVVLEAMSAGLPVIISENAGTADLIENGREGFVVPIRNTREIAEKLTFLYENRERCAHMGMGSTEALSKISPALLTRSSPPGLISMSTEMATITMV